MARRRRYGDKREITQDHTKALAEINSIIKGLGFSNDEIDAAKQELSKFMPTQVFLNRYGDQEGWAMLYAIYAPQIVHDYFREERGAAEKRQSPKARRLQYEELAGDHMDYVQSVFMGYHDDQDVFKGGVRSVAVAPEKDNPNRYVYDPTLKGREERPSICPHCGVSFWTKSAGNGDPQYQYIDGEPLREWRETEEEAPEHVRFNPTSGERAETGYSYCGGKHEVFDVTTDEGGLDIERAEQLSGLSWDELRSQNRVRSIEYQGGLRHFLVDEFLNDVEQSLGGNAAYKRFNQNWIYEKDGKLYRECRHPITLKSPNSVIQDRIARYTFNMSEKRSSGRVRKIKVYMCPECAGGFRDTEDITSGKGGAEKVNQVQCDDCGEWFNIDDLDEDMVYQMQWVDPQVSLNLSLQTEDGHTSELVDTISQKDIGYMEIEMAELLSLFQNEINKLSQSLNIRGSEYAKEILEDWVINGLDLREITDKYLGDLYQLHFTQCLDCGYTMEEKSNPDAAAKAKYDQGLPVAMIQCPNRQDPRHQVDLPHDQTPAQEQQVERVNPWVRNKEEHEDLQMSRDEEVARKMSEKEIADNLADPEQRRRYLGTNLVYHGRAPKRSGEVGQSWLVDLEQNTSEKLPAGDPRAYKGDHGIITRHIYAPAQRLIQDILNKLRENPAIISKHEDVLDTLDKWIRELGESAGRVARVKGFCKIGR